MDSSDGEKLTIVTQANLIAQGLFIQVEEGIQITPTGKELALNKWKALPPEDKLLYAWIIRKL